MEANKIIITGAATRMGAAIAKKLSGPGVEMVIHYNSSKSEAEKLQKELSKNKTKVYLVKGVMGLNMLLKHGAKLFYQQELLIRLIFCSFLGLARRSCLMISVSR